MNYISPCNHPESQLTASTIETMIDKSIELGLNYFAITDIGYMSAVLKGYMYGKKKDHKIIPGVEIFFKDNNCPIIKNTPSEKIKYFRLIVHAKDQKAYQKLVLMCSNFDNIITIKDYKYPLFTWKNLEEISKENVTVCTSNIECMITKHLLVGRPDIALAYYKKLKELFGNNLYLSIFPFKVNQYWDTVVEIDLGNKIVHIPPNDRVETDHYNMAKAIELTRNYSKHKELLYVYLNKIRYKVLPEYNSIKSAKLVNTFQNLPSGDAQIRANRFIIALSKHFNDGDRVLINNYSFYATEADKCVQDMKLGEENRISYHQHMRSTEEVIEYLIELGLNKDEIDKLVINSHNWANNFKDLELHYEYKLPDCGPNPEQQMIEIIKKNGRMKWDDPRYVKQFREEYELLVNNGKINLVPYFLPIVDINNYYNKNNKLVGVGRGSSSGFLLSYLMGITHIDPIKYDLSSARFLTLDRIQQGNLPDIDFDVQDRELLVGKDGNSGYFKEKYGNKFAQISTRTLLRIKSAILDVNRFVNNGTVEESVAKLSKSLPNTPQGLSDKDYIFGYEDSDGNHTPGLIETNEDLQKYATERPKEWDIVKKTLSLPRQCSRHASAWVLSNEPIENTIPIFSVGETNRVTQTEAKQCEYAGLIKYDFLVISVLEDINLCLKYINEHNKQEFETGYFLHNNKKTYIWDLPEEKSVFKMLWEGKTETIFQLNTTSVTPFIMQIKPKSIADCSAIEALVRPGALGFIDSKTGRNMAEEYVYRSNGTSKGEISILDELIPETYSIIVYQEQISKIAKELGQMNVIDSENVRIAMGKKKIKLMNELKPKFIEGALKKVDLETAEKVWSMMVTFAKYGFNKCLSGDTVLLRNKCGNRSLTIAEMYKAKNDIEWSKKHGKESVGKKYRKYGYGKAFSKKGDRLYHNNIVDIRYEGNKPVYKITTNNGSYIKGTKNHKFPTPNGETLLENLKIGDELYVNGGYEQEDTAYRYGGNNYPKQGEKGFQHKTNSSYSLYESNSNELKKNNECQICNCDLSKKRKEIHHKDNNHGNQEKSNLLLVCAGCHKKEHYKLGRTKQGEKGLLCLTSIITNIEYCGIGEVYDIEMETPYHNFVVDSGIVTCNSHSTAYATTSYACAFLKHNYPLEWWAAILSNADDKEINEVLCVYVKDMLLPPDINLSNEQMVIDYSQNKIRNKLSVIAGLGDKTNEKLIKNRPYIDIQDFVNKMFAARLWLKN